MVVRAHAQARDAVMRRSVAIVGTSLPGVKRFLRRSVQEGDEDGREKGRRSVCRPADTSHLVLAKFIGIKAFQPLLQPVIIGALRCEVDCLGIVDD